MSKDIANRRDLCKASVLNHPRSRNIPQIKEVPSAILSYSSGIYLALGTPRVMLLRFGPLRTVKRLMGNQIVHGGEFDATRGAD